jgi:hypothetical protein
MTLRRLTILCAVLAVAVLGTASSAGALPSEEFRSDSAAYNGSYSAVGFSVFGSPKGSYVLRNVRAVVELPSRYAGTSARPGFCAYARIGVNGVAYANSYVDCDTNGDATLRFYLPDIRARSGDYIEVWFSDLVTRFDEDHPVVIL